MTRAASSACPVRDLRAHVTAFEAALTVTLADPGVEPVHRLRTGSRRIEAQLVLLEQVPGLPDHAREARRAARSLAKVRAAAGQVRDLDVLRKLVKTMASDEGALADDAQSLRRALKKKRTRRCVWLAHTIEASRSKVAPRLEALLEVLDPAKDHALPASELIAISRGWFTGRVPSTAAVKPDDVEGLHAVRKAAKIARYLAEGAPGDADAASVAGAFEQVQQAGGEWHDLVLLTEIARRRLGASSPLAERAAQARDEALAAYQRTLATIPV